MLIKKLLKKVFVEEVEGVGFNVFGGMYKWRTVPDGGDQHVIIPFKEMPK